jgi:hypothetical protein
VNDDFDGVVGIPVRVPQTLRIQHVDLLAILLRASRVQEELDLGMGTAIRLLDARRRIKGVLLFFGLGCVRWEIRGVNRMGVYVMWLIAAEEI